MANTIHAEEARRDLELIKKVQKGDSTAFQTLVETYESRLYRLISGVVGNEEDARDVTQEAFVKIYLSLPEFRGQSSFFTWAYRITFNLAIDWKRKYGRIAAKTDSQSAEATEALVEHIPSDAAAADDTIYQQQQRAAINDALATMSPEQRAVVVLRDVDGLSYDDISVATGLPKGTVMSRLFYGRKKLMELLTPFRAREKAELAKENENRMKEGADTSNPVRNNLIEKSVAARSSSEWEARMISESKDHRFSSVNPLSLRPLKNGAGN